LSSCEGHAHALTRSPLISLPFNNSLASGYCPSDTKKAVMRPLFKKHGPDASQMKNYRTVSNLSFLYKLSETIVHIRFQTFWTAAV